MKILKMQGKWKLLFLIIIIFGGSACEKQSEILDSSTIEDNVNEKNVMNTEENEEWSDIPIIAHAMGMVQGRTETNSKDAFLESYQAGQRVFEVDLQITSDGKLVARHDWDQNSYFVLEQIYAGKMNWKTFMETPICFYYTPLDIDGIISLMNEYPDVYFVTDSKDMDKKTVQTQLKLISTAINKSDNADLWDRLIVQIYHEEMYEWVISQVPVKNWIFTLYQIKNPDFHKLGAFCQERNISVVTMPRERVDASGKLILNSYGCKVYLHTVNRIRAMQELYGWGADGYYSDYVTPVQFENALNHQNGMLLEKIPGEK